ncbi:MAG: SDR family oxidoreductase [Methylococcales bacterium]
MTKVLLTGANGFIGKALCAQLARKGFYINNAVRSKPHNNPFQHVVTTIVGEINADTPWQTALEQIDIVIHLAARVHITRENAANSLAEFRKVNVQGTINLAKQAAKAGVKRFIFISSIKFNGEATRPGLPFTADDPPAPVDAYGISKREAEDALRLLAGETGMEVVIIRPPIVYGPGVKANFRAMLYWLNNSIPLPLGAIHNQRSLLALDNLVDLIETCVSHPSAANQTFLVADGEDLTTTELIKRMAIALGKKTYLLPVPVWLIKLIAVMLGKKNIAQKLCDSLQVDTRKTRELLGWEPPVSVDEALRRTAQDYKESHKC